jgi:hypothetical protein
VEDYSLFLVGESGRIPDDGVGKFQVNTVGRVAAKRRIETTDFFYDGI